MSAVTVGARREGGAPADGGSAQTPSARSPAPASREPVRPSVQPRLHRLGTRRPRRLPAAHRRRGERAPVGRSASRGEGWRRPALRGGTAVAAAEGRGGTGERELRPAGARAEGRNGGGPRRGEERRRPLRKGEEEQWLPARREARAPAAAHGWAAAASARMRRGATGLSGKAREAPPSELVRL